MPQSGFFPELRHPIILYLMFCPIPCLCLDSCFSLSLGLCLESCFLLLYHRIRIVRKTDTDHRFFSGRCTVHFHINMITFVMYFICPIVSRIETFYFIQFISVFINCAKIRSIERAVIKCSVRSEIRSVMEPCDDALCQISFPSRRRTA